MNEIEFAKFYEEQNRQNSNIYYALARGPEPARRRYPVRKIAVSFAGVTAVLILAFSFFSFSKKEISAVVANADNLANGFDELILAQDALSRLRPTDAHFSLNSAYRGFQSANPDFSRPSALVLDLVNYFPFLPEDWRFNGSDIARQSEVAEAGKELAQSAEALSRLIRRPVFGAGDEEGWLASDDSIPPDAISDFKKSKENLMALSDRLKKANYDSLAALISKIDAVIEGSSRLIIKFQLLTWIYGDDRLKTFVIVAQNSAQARATGGAIVSVGTLVVDRGRVLKASFDDVYDLDGQLQAKIVPPRPVQKIDTVWSLHNANWFFDFPTSAKKIAYFYQKARGIKPDGVLALNEKVMEKVLPLTSPVEMIKYDLTIDADNFRHLTAFNIFDEKRSAQARRVFNDLIPLVLEKLASVPEEKMAEVWNTLNGAAQSKDLLVWLDDSGHEKIVSNAGWGGGALDAPGSDYLAVVATDLGGRESAVPMEQSIVKETEISETGEVVNTVTVTRRLKADDSLPDIAPVPVYVRLYAPEGSELISVSGQSFEEISAPIDYEANGFRTDEDAEAVSRTMKISPESSTEIFKESGKTVFADWMEVGGREPAAMTFKYKLPSVMMRDDPKFVFQKQPGTESALSFKVVPPDGLVSAYQYEGDFNADLIFPPEK